MASTIIGPLVSVPAQNNSTWTLRSADIGDYIGRKARLVVYHASGPAYDGDIQLDDFNIGGNTFDPESGTHYFETNKNQDNTQNVSTSDPSSAYAAVEWKNLETGSSNADTHAGRFWRDSGGTPSGSTGNTTGYTGNYYYYCENSSAGSSNDVWLRSRIVTVDSSTLSFYTAQNGANCGAIYAYLEVFDEGISAYGATNYGDGYYSAVKFVDASSTISNSSSASAIGERIHRGASAISNSSGSSAQAFLTANRSASTTANSTVDGLGLRIGTANSIVVNTSGVVTAAQRIQQPSATDSATSGTSANGQGTFARSASTSASSSTSSSAEIIRLGVSNDIAAISGTTASGDAAIGGSASTACTSTASSSGLRIGESSGTVNGTASGTASANYTVSSATATANATVSIDLLGERIARAESIVETSSGTVSGAEVIKLSDASLSSSSTSDSAGLRIADGSAQSDGSSTVDSAGLLIQQGDAQVDGLATSTSAGQVIYLSSVAGSATSSTTASGLAVRESSALSEADTFVYANGVASINGDASTSAETSTSSNAERIQLTSGVVSSTSVVITIGREKWEPIGTATNSWAAESQASTTWTNVA
jgi:hypothetical protein